MIIIVLICILQLIYCRWVQRRLIKLTAERKWTELVSIEIPVWVGIIPIVGPLMITVLALLDYSEVKEELRRSGKIVTLRDTWICKIVDWFNNADLKK